MTLSAASQGFVRAEDAIGAFNLRDRRGLLVYPTTTTVRNGRYRVDPEYFSDLQEHIHYSTCVALVGPAGTGKTFMSLYLAAQWQRVAGTTRARAFYSTANALSELSGLSQLWSGPLVREEPCLWIVDDMHVDRELGRELIERFTEAMSGCENRLLLVGLWLEELSARMPKVELPLTETTLDLALKATCPDVPTSVEKLQRLSRWHCGLPVILDYARHSPRRLEGDVPQELDRDTLRHILKRAELVDASQQEVVLDLAALRFLGVGLPSGLDQGRWQTLDALEAAGIAHKDAAADEWELRDDEHAARIFRVSLAADPTAESQLVARAMRIATREPSIVVRLVRRLAQASNETLRAWLNREMPRVIRRSPLTALVVSEASSELRALLFNPSLPSLHAFRSLTALRLAMPSAAYAALVAELLHARGEDLELSVVVAPHDAEVVYAQLWSVLDDQAKTRIRHLTDEQIRSGNAPPIWEDTFATLVARIGGEAASLWVSEARLAEGLAERPNGFAIACNTLWPLLDDAAKARIRHLTDEQIRSGNAPPIWEDTFATLVARLGGETASLWASEARLTAGLAGHPTGFASVSQQLWPLLDDRAKARIRQLTDEQIRSGKAPAISDSSFAGLVARLGGKTASLWASEARLAEGLAEHPHEFASACNTLWPLLDDQAKARIGELTDEQVRSGKAPPIWDSSFAGLVARLGGEAASLWASEARLTAGLAGHPHGFAIACNTLWPLLDDRAKARIGQLTDEQIHSGKAPAVSDGSFATLIAQLGGETASLWASGARLAEGLAEHPHEFASACNALWAVLDEQAKGRIGHLADEQIRSGKAPPIWDSSFAGLVAQLGGETASLWASEARLAAGFAERAGQSAFECKRLWAQLDASARTRVRRITKDSILSEEARGPRFTP